jgi:hypothetical protein
VLKKMMSSYHINEGFFLGLPEGEDETTNVLGWPLQDKNSSPFSLTINRDGLQPGENLQTYAARQFKTLEQELNGYQMLNHQTTRRVEGLATEEVEFIWVSDGDQMAQRQAYVIYQDRALVFTATMMEKFTPEGTKLWNLLLSHFRFRKGKNPIKLKQAFYQSKIQNILEVYLKTGIVMQTVAIQTTDGTEVADVAWVSEQRAKVILEDEVASIAPEICIEIISISNTEAEIHYRKKLYLGAGAEEVWIYNQEGQMLFYDRQEQLKRSVLVPDFPLTIPS